VRGYPAVAEFISSDKVFNIFRRFDSLAARNLLYMQDELCELEENLENLEQADTYSNSATALQNLCSRRHDCNIEKQKIMNLVREKLRDYREWLIVYLACAGTF
jgi:hypothetical protein